MIGGYDHFFNANVVLPRDTRSVDFGEVPPSNLWINGTAKPVLINIFEKFPIKEKLIF